MYRYAVFTDTRAMFGDPVKESFVGIYQTEDAHSFENTLRTTKQEVNSGKWIAPSERAELLRKKLKSRGFTAMTCESTFVPFC